MEDLGGQGDYGLACETTPVQVAVGSQMVSGGAAWKALLDHYAEVDEPLQCPVNGGAMHRAGGLGGGEQTNHLIGADVRWGPGQQGEDIPSGMSDPLARITEPGDSSLGERVNFVVVTCVLVHRRQCTRSMPCTSVAPDAAVFHLWASFIRDPRGTVITEGQNANGWQVHHVFLGYQQGASTARWFTAAEISAAVLTAVDENSELLVVGQIDPWDQRS